ncbi:MAG: hypothetical protein A2W31_05610 [Planctomycetes bacterium RBG_16_64_10]|nr:MAG: hypothetical protein A2W31_05610 [Planctomycetes bacterium RBG_16_64_10]
MGQRRIGPYQLLGLIRAGHACEIWKIMRIGEESRMAMKLLRRGDKYTREQVDFLKHEYTVASRLQHDGVIRIHDCQSNPEGCYLIMELFAHPNLKQTIQLGVERLAYLAETIIRQSAAGLQYLHEQGWVHCDVKPDNFLVGDDGHVKLIDFSLAQRQKGRLSRLISGKARIQGTKSYMSPEQILGAPVDARSDIYSFGCVVYELIGGRVPFTGVSANALLTKHLRAKPPALEAANKNVTRDFSQLVARMMAKDPNRRPRSMQVLLDELRGTPLFQQRPLPPAAEGPKPDRR